MLRRLLTGIFIFTCLTNHSAFALSAKSAILIDAQAGRVLMEQDAHTRRPMASTTKIMTALIALEKGNLNDVVTVSRSASYVEGSSIWLKEGEKLTLEDLLYGLMLNSGNDAATAIAEHIAGSIPKFAEMMNEKVRQMGLKDTSFDNPHGLVSDTHYTSAYDLAQIAREALKNPKFAQIVSTKTKSIPREGSKWGRSLKNHNRLLSVYEGADGVKTGFTKVSGRTLVSSATRGGIKLIAVTLKASDDWNDHMEMLNYGFSICRNESILYKGQYVKTIPVKNGTEQYAQIVSNTDLFAVLTDKDNNHINLNYEIPEELKAPISAGQEIGKVTAYMGNEEIGSASLINMNEIVAIKKEGFIDKLGEILQSIFTLF